MKDISIDMIRTGDLIRKFSGEIGMVFIYNNERFVVYKEGWDWIPDILNEIKDIARPNEPWMYSPAFWTSSNIWEGECLIHNTTMRVMTKEELNEAGDIHTTLGYTLIIKGD